jgi:SpoVK/Ycf46/Vps4 family AAA+-type ATPase
VTGLPEGPAQWDAVVRSSTIDGLPVVLEVEGQLADEVRARIERAHHLRWAITSPIHLPLSSLPDRAWTEVEVRDARATVEEWAARFPSLDAPAFPLSADQLDQVARAADALGGDLVGAMRRLAAGHIDNTAARIQPSRTWDDLVLDDERSSQVREIAIRARHRDVVFGGWGFDPKPSSGIVALFAGPSGTGKTLAAEIIAGDLGVDLYKIDLANLVSKYIGETEKNLARIFETAEASNVVLFFDEADALLGKRSDVSDAHDRYANIEVAYLLQRLERYEGVAVMATNLVRNIDDAFLRRLHVIVEFPMPEAPERRRIWARCLPAGAPLAADLDLDLLGREIEVSGGTIRNAALAAAFLAADAGTPITMDFMVTALRRELQKMGRLASAAEFSGLDRR